MNTIDLIKKYQHVFHTNYTQDANCEAAYLMEVDEDPLSDASGNNNTAALKGAGEPAFASGDPPPGGFSSSYYVWDGNDDYATISDHSDIKVANAYAIMAYFKADDTSLLGYIVTSSHGAGDRNQLVINSNVIAANNYDGSFYGGTEAFTDTTSWHHVALVNASQGSATGYLDGVAMTGTGWLGASDDVAGKIGSNTALDWTFKGSIDEVALFSRVLDSTEINDIMDNGLQGIVSNPYPTSHLKKDFISGYHCFMNAYLRASVEGFDPLKLPDGTVF